MTDAEIYRRTPPMETAGSLIEAHDATIIKSGLPEMRLAGLQHRFDANDAKTAVHLLKVDWINKQVRGMPNVLIGKEVEALCPLVHEFTRGQYIRTMSCPAGVLVVTAIHKTDHPFFLMKGEVTVLTEDGAKRLKAPLHGITKAGTQRVCVVHEDVEWITVHATDETDISKIEASCVISDLSDEQIEQLMELT